MKWLEVVPDLKYSNIKYYEAVVKRAEIDVQVSSIESHGIEINLKNLVALSPDTDLYLLSPFFNLKAREIFTTMATQIYQTNEFDAIRVINGELRPVHFYHLSLQNFVSNEIVELDRNASALIAGHQFFPTGVASNLAQMGFKRVRLVAGDKSEAEKFIAHWTRSYFSVDWAFVDPTSLTEDSGRFSLLVNCELENQQVLNTLYYFNFLQPSGVVIDYRMLGSDCDLIREANEIEARAYSGLHMFAHRMQTLIEELALGQVSLEDLTDALSQVEAEK